MSTNLRRHLRVPGLFVSVVVLAFLVLTANPLTAYYFLDDFNRADGAGTVLNGTWTSDGFYRGVTDPPDANSTATILSSKLQLTTTPATLN